MKPRAVHRQDSSQYLLPVLAENTNGNPLHRNDHSSFYHETRIELTMAARREWTVRWWDALLPSDSIVSSLAVLDELKQGDFPS